MKQLEKPGINLSAFFFSRDTLAAEILWRETKIMKSQIRKGEQLAAACPSISHHPMSNIQGGWKQKAGQWSVSAVLHRHCKLRSIPVSRNLEVSFTDLVFICTGCLSAQCHWDWGDFGKSGKTYLRFSIRNECICRNHTGRSWQHLQEDLKHLMCF